MQNLYQSSLRRQMAPSRPPLRGVLLWLLAASVLGLGLLDLRPATLGPLDVHTVFGILLSVYVVVRFLWQAQGSLPGALEMRRVVRQQSREVYLLMYLLVTGQLCRHVIDWTPILQGLPNALIRTRIAAPLSMQNRMEDFQGYLASGFVALIALRILASLQQAQRQRRVWLTRRAPPL